MLTLGFLLCVLIFAEADDNAPSNHLRTRQRHTEHRNDPWKPSPNDDANSLAIETNTTAIHRQLQQVRTVLVVRVINSGVGPSVSARTIRQYTFTDPNSLKAQMMRCSANALILTESPLFGSVLDVHVNTAMDADALKIAARHAASGVLGDLRKAASHIMFVFPNIPGYLAEAETGYGLSYYSDQMSVSLGVVMHEIGHNLGLSHSGLVGDEYGDYSGYMGLARVRRGGPLMCYNAANHWDLGWFGRRDLGFYGPSTPLSISLNAFTNGGTVLLKIAGNIFMQYNAATAHNIDTDPAMANKVVIVQKTLNDGTIRLAALNIGQEYRSPYFVVRACSRTTTLTMVMSIGRTYTNCHNTASVPAPSSWWQLIPSPTPPAPSSWNANPTKGSWEQSPWGPSW